MIKHLLTSSSQEDKDSLTVNSFLSAQLRIAATGDGGSDFRVHGAFYSR